MGLFGNWEEKAGISAYHNICAVSGAGSRDSGNDSILLLLIYIWYEVMYAEYLHY